jgi:quinol monooxygenase YgiN
MYGMLVKIVAKPGKIEELIQFLRHDASVAATSERGSTLRFDVWAVPHQPNAVYLYEAYIDQEAFARHQANVPYKMFVNVIKPQLINEMQGLFGFTGSLVSNTD